MMIHLSDYFIQFYRIIVLAPDIIDRILYRDFLNIALQQLQFEAAFIHQVISNHMYL